MHEQSGGDEVSDIIGCLYLRVPLKFTNQCRVIMTSFSYILCASIVFPFVTDACKIAFGSMPNLNNHINICHKLYVFVVTDISEKKRYFCYSWYSSQP